MSRSAWTVPEIVAESSFSTRSAYLLAGVTASIVVALDRITKLWAVDALVDGDVVAIDGILEFELAFNSGAAYGLFKGGGSVIAVAAIIASGLIIFALRSVD